MPSGHLRASADIGVVSIGRGVDSGYFRADFWIAPAGDVDDDELKRIPESDERY